MPRAFGANQPAKPVEGVAAITDATAVVLRLPVEIEDDEQLFGFGDIAGIRIGV
jgi:hypothetical protein